MQPQQSEHIATVVHVVEDGIDAPKASAHDAIIKESWSRCVLEHQLDPTRMQEAVILPGGQVRERQDRMEEFLHIARHGLETLYHQVAGLGYCVLLTDARGVTVDFLGDLVFEPSLKKAGLYLGADWSEQVAGTCGVGTCIATGEALTVHLADHFDATHIPLTCTTAPVYNAVGELMAVLDVSQLSSTLPKDSQHLALQLVRSYAQHIENATFLRRFYDNWVLHMSDAPQFLDVNPEYLLAVDAGGNLIGHNRRAQVLLEDQWGQAVIGWSLSKLFDIDFNRITSFTTSRAPDERALTVAGGGQVLFVLATPPRRKSVARQSQETPKTTIPKPLAALSGGDPVLDRQLERAARLVNSPISMLLSGETGTGKEYFAKALHASSKRNQRPFVAVNCAAIPASLIESELFGYQAGSFSGARPKGKRGLIQEADGGTLFLDEIGDMAPDLQARLLRVLAEREVLPIGATRPIPVNIRVIAATHCDLESLVRQGLFRDDLYYRLNGAQVSLPALRDRLDFDWLLDQMLNTVTKETDEEPLSGVPIPVPSARAYERLRAHQWPGNLRELHNAIEFARAICSHGVIELTDLPDQIQRAENQVDAQLDTAESADAMSLKQHLKSANWNISAVARQLGVARMTVYRRMQRYGIGSPNRSP